MKVSVLFVSALLVLTAAAEQDVEENNQQTGEDPDPQDLVPEAGDSVKTPADSETRPDKPSPFMFQRSHLKWQSTSGSLISGAVSIWNSYARRTDYVCKYGCHAGFFNPAVGSFCNYPYGGKEYRGRPFQLLVNKENFDILEWKGGSWGSVPPNPIKTCSSTDLYVAKNQFGLGKVHARHKAFFLPWRGKEYWYKHYEVLTFRTDVYKEHISNVRYHTSAIKIKKYPPETMRRSFISNYECRPVTKSLQLSKTEQVEKRWDRTTSTTIGVTTSISAQIPLVGSIGVSFSAETTKQLSRGGTVMSSNTYTVTVEQSVPPNYSCGVSMVGYKYKADIPYTARLTRTYHNSRTTSRTITGTYSGVDVGEVRSVVDRCKPIPNAEACRRTDEGGAADGQ